MWFGMRLMWFCKVPLCGFCVHCTLYSRIYLADFMLVFARKNPQIHLRESKKSAESDFWPVKVTLKVIKWRMLVFCWSCDKDPFKLYLKNHQSLQFVNTDQMSLLLTISANGRSKPLSYYLSCNPWKWKIKKFDTCRHIAFYPLKLIINDIKIVS